MKQLALCLILCAIVFHPACVTDSKTAQPDLTQELVKAIRENNSQRAAELLDQGIDVNKPIPDHGLPLHIAVENGSREIISLLIERGADTSLPDQKGRTALDLAKEKGDDTTSAMLTITTKEPLKTLPKGTKGYPVRLNGQWGFIDNKGNLLVKPVINAQDIGEFNTEKIIIKSFDRFEIIDRATGRVIVPREKVAYEDISRFQEGLARVKRNGLYGFIDTGGKLVIGLQYQDAGLFSENLAAVKKNNQWGYIDNSGTVAIELQFERASPFSNGLAAVKRGKYWGYLDKQGTVIVEPRFSYCQNFKGNLALVELDGKYGMIDRNGREIIPVQYESCSEFSDQLAGIKTKGQYGYVDKQGKIAIAPAYDSCSPFHQGLSTVRRNDHAGVIDTGGRIIVPFEYDSIGAFHNGLAAARKDGKSGFIDTTGAVVIALQFDSAEDFQQGLAAASRDGKWGYINTKGEFVIEPRFDSCSLFTNGRAHVRLDNHALIIDTSGAEIFPAGDYNYIRGNGDNPLVAEISGKVGMVDVNGSVILEPTYDEIAGFSPALYRVMLDNRCGLLDAKTLKMSHRLDAAHIDMLENLPRSGDEISIRFFNDWSLKELPKDKLCYFQKNNKYGLIDLTGKIIVEPRFEDMLGFHETAVRIMENGKWGLLDSRSGKIILEPQYLEINDFAQGLAAFKKASKYNVKNGKNISRIAFDTPTGTDVELWGFMDGTGKTAIKPQYARAKKFSEGLCFVSSFVALIEGRLLHQDVYINKSNTRVFDVPEYDTIWTYFTGGVVRIKINDKYGLINNKGAIIVKAELDDIDFFNVDSSYVVFEKNGKKGLISNTGKIIIEPVYDDVRKISEDYSAVKTDGRYMIISNKTQKLSGNFVCDYISYAYSDKLHQFETGGKKGLCDPSGKILIRPEFDDLGTFVEGLAFMATEHLYGYIDKNGKQIVKPQFDSAGSFDHGIARVWFGNRFGYITTKGDFIWRPTE